MYILYLLLVSSVSALTLSGTPFPPRIYYSEGKNLSIPVFLDIRAVGNESLVTFDLSTFFYPSNVPTSEANTSIARFTGSMAEVNLRLSSLHFLVGEYENRKFYLELRVYADATIRYGGIILEGVANNTSPFVEGVKLETVYNGALSTPQKVEPAIFNAFVDTNDLYYNPSDPGIQKACLSCVGVRVVGEPCISFSNAKAGAFSLQGQSYKVPKCEVWVTDIDPNGENALSSPRYQLLFIFTAKQTYGEMFIAWNKSIEGVLFWLGVLFGIVRLRGNIKDGSRLVAPSVYLMCQRYKIAVWRFGYTDMQGRNKSSDVLPWVNKKNLCFVTDVSLRLRRADMASKDPINDVMKSLLEERVLKEYEGLWKYVMRCLSCRYYILPSSYSQVDPRDGIEIA